MRNAIRTSGMLVTIHQLDGGGTEAEEPRNNRNRFVNCGHWNLALLRVHSSLAQREPAEVAAGRAGAHGGRSGLCRNALLLENPRSQSRCPTCRVRSRELGFAGSNPQQVLDLVSAASLIKPVEFKSVGDAIELAWHFREGLLGLIGKNRPEGSTLITEDVSFASERSARGARGVQELLAKHGFNQ